MEIAINHHTLSIGTQATLSSALEQAGFHESRGLAVALNDTVIPKKEWARIKLQERDKITVVKATQGG